MDTVMSLISLWTTYSVWGFIALYPMWHKRNKKKSKTVMLIALLLVAAESLIIVFLKPDNQALQIFKLLGFFIYLFLSFFLYRGFSFQCLFLLAVSCMYQTSILEIGVFVEENIDGPVSVLYPFFIDNALSIAASLLLLPFLLRMLRKIFNIVGMEQSSFWRMVWIIPMLFFIMCIFTEDATINKDNSSALSFITVRLLMTAAMLFICYFISSVLKAEVRSAEAEENSRMMELQLSLQAEQYDLIAASIKNARAARHDMRQHVSVIRGFLSDNNYGAINLYLDEYLKHAPQISEEILSKNHAVNALLRYYLAIAQKESIDVDIKVDIPEHAGTIPDVDLCIIIGNFFENALEACRRIKEQEDSIFIKMRSRVRNGYLTIVMDNSFDGTLSQEHGIFYSRKHKGEGIGLSSVKAIAKRYDGNTMFRADGLVFQSSVVLKMGNSPLSTP